MDIINDCMYTSLTVQQSRTQLLLDNVNFLMYMRSQTMYYMQGFCCTTLIDIASHLSVVS